MCIVFLYTSSSYGSKHFITIFLFSEVSVNIKWLNLKLIAHADPVMCPNGCGKNYAGPTRKKCLKEHLMYECGVLPKFECNICFKKLYRKCSLKVHLISVHNHVPNF